MKAGFEQKLQRLEEIVEDLEQGNQSLDASLKAFEEGIKLSRACHAELAEAQKKVEILIQAADGTTETQPFEG